MSDSWKNKLGRSDERRGEMVEGKHVLIDTPAFLKDISLLFSQELDVNHRKHDEFLLDPYRIQESSSQSGS